MPDSAEQVLKTIPSLIEGRDAVALVGLQDHPDRAVRKAVRKAIHRLRSAGVEIPDKAPQSWSEGGIVQQLRGDLEPVAMLDTHGLPGATRFMLSIPERDEGARLLVGVLGPDDRVLDFSAFMQTDGQRARLARDWERIAGGRRVPHTWVRQRLRWGRERTVLDGFSVPDMMDDALSELGDPPGARPESFLHGQLDDETSFDPEKIQLLALEVGVHRWPPLVALENTIGRVAQLHAEGESVDDEASRLELLRKATRGDAAVSAGLRGPVADLVEDAAVTLWLEGKSGSARAALDVAAELRKTEAPQELPWVGQILSLLVAGFVQRMGAMASNADRGIDTDGDLDEDELKKTREEGT